MTDQSAGFTRIGETFSRPVSEMTPQERRDRGIDMTRTLIVTLEGRTEKDLQRAENRIHDGLRWLHPPVAYQVVSGCLLLEAPVAAARFVQADTSAAVCL